VRLSGHARYRIGQMGLREADVLAAVEEPEMSWPSSLRGQEGCTVHVCGRFAVVVNHDAGVVVTVVWHGEESRYDERGRMARDAGRA
jgi:hypothetical protein